MGIWFVGLTTQHPVVVLTYFQFLPFYLANVYGRALHTRPARSAQLHAQPPPLAFL